MPVARSMQEQKNQAVVSIIIPFYNESPTLLTVFERVAKSDTCGLHKEIIFIDDGSTDDGAKKLKQKLNHDTRIQARVLRHAQNCGKGAAIKTALSHTSGTFIIIQDADLEYDPVDYPSLLTPLMDGKAHAVFGSRFISSKPHRVLFFWHYVANRFLTTFSNALTNLNLSDMETGYKAFDANLLRSLQPRLRSRRFGFEPEITAYLAHTPGIRIYEVGISYAGRTYAQGKKIKPVDGLRAMWEIVYFNVIALTFKKR